MGAVGVAALAGCTDEDGPSSSGEASGSSGQDIEILSDEWYEEGYNAGVRGEIKNVSGDELSYVQIEANFYDDGGAKIGDGMDNTSDLPADTVYKFDVMYMDTDAENVADYELSVDVSF